MICQYNVANKAETTMKFVSDREFRNEPGKVRKELADQEVILTSRGKPYAVLLPVDDSENIADVLELAARMRAQKALSSVRRKAAESGLDTMSLSDIEEEIEQARKQRQR
jgi:prevent-host-death family protein